MSDTKVTIPVNERTPDSKTRLKPKSLGDKLPPDQRKWAGNVLKALGLKPVSSQNRIMAGAISSGEIIAQTSQSKTERDTAEKLVKQVVKAGIPPWNGDTAMRVGAAKVQLDMMTIPPDQRQLRALSADAKGVNQAMWIERIDADGTKRSSFLCKTATPNPDDEMGPSGGPKGGEVAREALAGRAAGWIEGMLQFDLGMPETHVVKLDGGIMGGTAGQEMTCSVQEARESVGDLRGASKEARARMKRDQIAAMAVFDTMTLNTDRHSGNFLIDADDNLIPIDHGESFIEPNETGLNRLQAAMGGPHNALLGLPGAHEPLTSEMRGRLKAIDPKGFAKTLSGDNGTIGKQHGDMKGAISDDAIGVARRAARFTQLAAKAEPPMSPAGIQVAMGNSAKLLFAPGVGDREFEQAAALVIKRFSGQGEVLKLACTAADAEWDKLTEKVEALGWKVARRGGEPSAEGIGDPLTLLKIIADQAQAPIRLDAQQAMLQQMAQSAPVPPAEATDMLLQNTIDALRAAILLAAPARQQGLASTMTKALFDQSGEPRPQAKKAQLLPLVLPIAVQAASEELTRQLDQAQATSSLEALVAGKLLPYLVADYDLARGYLERQRPELAKPPLDRIVTHVGNNKYIHDASNTVIKLLNRMADSLSLPATDDDLKDGLRFAAQQQPLAAKQKLDRLKVRAKGLQLLQRAVAAMQTELDGLKRDFVIDPNSPVLQKAETAIADGDLEQAYLNLEMVRNKALESATPSAANMAKLADQMGLPDDDPALLEALQAATNNDAPAAALKWRAVIATTKAEPLKKTIKDRLQLRLDTLLQGYDIPERNPSRVLAQEALAADHLDRAPYHLDRLDALAAADKFASK